jgi:histone H3/H4
MSQVSQVSQVPKRKNKKSNPIREIKIQQSKTGFIIPAAPFRRLVDEMTFPDDIRYQQEAIEALQTAAESHLIEIFQKANKLAIYKGRETLHSVDISLAHDLYK